MLQEYPKNPLAPFVRSTSYAPLNAVAQMMAMSQICVPQTHQVHRCRQLGNAVAWRCSMRPNWNGQNQMLVELVQGSTVHFGVAIKLADSPGEIWWHDRMHWAIYFLVSVSGYYELENIACKGRSERTLAPHLASPARFTTRRGAPTRICTHSSNLFIEWMSCLFWPEHQLQQPICYLLMVVHVWAGIYLSGQECS